MISAAAYIVVLVVSVIAIIAGFAVVWIADKNRETAAAAAAAAAAGGTQAGARGRNNAQEPDQDGDDDDSSDDDDGHVRRRRRRVVPARGNVRPGAVVQAQAGARNQAVESDDETEDEPVLPQAGAGGKKGVGVKKMAKLQMKEQRRQEREAMEEQRRIRKAKELIEEQERLTRKQKEVEERLTEEQEEERRKKELEQEEQRVLDEWKGMFEVVEQGTSALDADQQKQQDEQFIEHVKSRKIVLLEELSVKFKLRTQDVVDRLQAWDSQGILPGVIDDRGKFVYITEDEMSKISKFIMRRGRVTIDEITKECNRIIDLSVKLEAANADDDNEGHEAAAAAAPEQPLIAV